MFLCCILYSIFFFTPVFNSHLFLPLSLFLLASIFFSNPFQQYQFAPLYKHHLLSLCTKCFIISLPDVQLSNMCFVNLKKHWDNFLFDICMIVYFLFICRKITTYFLIFKFSKLFLASLIFHTCKCSNLLNFQKVYESSLFTFNPAKFVIFLLLFAFCMLIIFIYIFYLKIYQPHKPKYV